MAELNPGRLWTMRGAYFGIALIVFFVQLLPLKALPNDFAGPEVLTALTFAWALRRPGYVPILSVALVMFMADLLFQRPPGLWALLVLYGAEWLKSGQRSVRENTFAAEWLTIAVLLAVLTVVYRVTLGVVIPAPGPVFLYVQQYVMTVLAYPLVTAFSYLVLGVRRTTRGGYDTGRKA